MRWSFIQQWKTCLVTSHGGGGRGKGDKSTKMRIRDHNGDAAGKTNEEGETKIQNTTSTSIAASTSTSVASTSAHGGGGGAGAECESDETDTDLITVSVTNDTLKRWSVGSATNSEGEYSKVVVQFGSELTDCDCDFFGWETDTLKDETLIYCNGNGGHGHGSGKSGSPETTVQLNGTQDQEQPQSQKLKRNNNGAVCFVIPLAEKDSDLESLPSTVGTKTRVKCSPTNVSQIIAAIEGHASPANSVSSGGGGGANLTPNGSVPQTAAAAGHQYVDRWRILFNRFDLEGFGEIPWDYFYYIALRSPYFINEVEPGKLEMLRDLAKDKLQQLQDANYAKGKRRTSSSSSASPCTAITFQYFVNLMTGKRSRSFKCAVHHRDREISSENDFKLVQQQQQPSTTSSQSHDETGSECTSFFRQSMVSCLATEFLTDDRDRKFYTSQYSCCPPPIFIPILTLIQTIFFTYYILYHTIWPDEELLLEEEVEASSESALVCLSFTTAYYKPTPIISSFVYRPDRKLEPWRFLFYALLHASWPHFIFNVVVQVLVGLPLEMVHGTGRIFFVYILGVIGSALSVSVLDPTANLVGGAGGVYALLVAHCSNMLLYTKSSPLVCARVWRSLRILLMLLAASVDVGIAVYNRYIVILAPGPSAIDFELQRIRGLYVEVAILRQELAPISYLGHITGVILGLNVGLVILRNFQQSLRQQLIWWCTLCMCSVCIFGAVVLNLLGVGNIKRNTLY